MQVVSSFRRTDLYEKLTVEPTACFYFLGSNLFVCDIVQLHRLHNCLLRLLGFQVIAVCSVRLQISESD